MPVVSLAIGDKQPSKQCLRYKTVGDLTDQHRGWQINVIEPESIAGHRMVDFDGLRRWTYEGTEMVGLLCKEYDRPYKHMERAYSAETPCQLLWQIRKPKPRKRVAS
jgi:hypothetical protein